MKRATKAFSLLRALFVAAIKAGDPALVVPAALPDRPGGRTVVIGAGKASAGMAAALEAHWNSPLEGLVVTRSGQADEGAACRAIRIVEAAHPVPDAAGREAADEICRLLAGLGPDDLVIALISGGGSALLSKPLPGISFKDKQELTAQLLDSGASIGEINVVRQHLSAVKGGRLAALAAPAKMVTLAISDVPGDAPDLIASGPTVASGATPSDAMEVLTRHALQVPDHVCDVLHSEAARLPDPSSIFFAQNEVHVIASARRSLEAAQSEARRQGIEAVILSDRIEGEARDAAKVLAAIAVECAQMKAPFSPPVILLSGGETSVKVIGTGRGGRNSEFALAAAQVLEGIAGIYGLAADTDGIDGSEDNAGAFFDAASFGRMRDKGINPSGMLDNNDAYSAFAAIDDLFVTGPTGTNVNDLRAFYIAADGKD